MVTCYVTKITASCSAMIDVAHGTIKLLLRDKVHVVMSILLITRSRESVETGLSHLKCVQHDYSSAFSQ